MSNRERKEKRDLTPPPVVAANAPDSGKGSEKRRERAAKADRPKPPEKPVAKKTAASVSMVAQRRTRKFLGHYWRLFNYTRVHVGTSRVVHVALLAITATLAQGGILLLAATFASFMESGGTLFQAYGIGFLEGNTLSALIAFSIPALILLLYASLASYWAAKLMRKYARTTQLILTRRVLRNVKWLDRTDLSDVLPTPSSLKRLFSRDLRQAGMSMDKMLRLIQPAIYIVLALVTIFYLEPFLSLALLAIGSVMLPLVYLLSRRIQENAINFYNRDGTEASNAVSTLVMQLQSANAGPGAHISEDWLEKHPAFVAYLDTYDRLKLGPKYMALRASLLRSIFVICGLLAIGWLAIEGERSWSVLVIYVGALLFLATGLQAFLMTLALLIKYYPQTQNAATVIKRLEAASREAPPVPEVPDELTLTARMRLEDSERRRKVLPTDRVVLFSKTPLGRLSFQTYLQPLRRASDAPPAFWDTSRLLISLLPLPYDRVGTAVLGDENVEAKRDWLEGFLKQALSSTYEELLPEGLETELTEERWNALPPECQSTLALASICAEQRGALFLDAEFEASLPDGLLQHLIQENEIRYLFIENSEAGLTLNADHYVVADEKAVVGLGDANWAKAQEDAIESMVARKDKGDSMGGDDEDF